MKHPIIFLVFVLLMAACAESKGDAIIPLKAERNVSLISVKIGKVEIPNILLDTGFDYDGIIIYNPIYKESLDWSNAKEARIAGAGSGSASKALLIDSASFSIGNVQMANQRIVMLQGDLYKGFPSNGVIGYSIFGHYMTELDYDRNIMTLHDSDKAEMDSSWTAVPLYFKGNKVPWLDASIVVEKGNPIPLSMYIDFAAGDALTLLEKPDMKFSPPRKTVRVRLGRGLSGDVYGKRGTISKLLIGKHELKNVIASVAPSKVRSKQENADAILGSGALRRFNVIFDYSRKVLYLKPNAYFNAPFR